MSATGSPCHAEDDAEDAPPGTAAAKPPVPPAESTCRICYEEASPGNALLSPCKCRGSLAHIHESCLSEYLRVGPPTLHCRICSARYTLPPGFQLPPSEHEAREIAAERRREAELLLRQQQLRQHPMTLRLALTLGGVAIAAVGAAVFCARTSQRHAQRQRMQRLQRLQQESKWRHDIEAWIQSLMRHPSVAATLVQQRRLRAEVLAVQSAVVQYAQHIQLEAQRHEQRWRSLRTVRPSDLRRRQDREEVQAMVEARLGMAREAAQTLAAAERSMPRHGDEIFFGNRTTQELQEDDGDDAADEVQQQQQQQQQLQRRRGGHGRAAQQVDQHTAKLRQEQFEWTLCYMANTIGNQEARHAASLLRPLQGTLLDELPDAPPYRPGSTASAIADLELKSCLLHLDGVDGIEERLLSEWKREQRQQSPLRHLPRSLVSAGHRIMRALLPGR